MEKEWLSVAEMAKIAEIPDSSLRRYLERFSQHFRFELRPKGRRYHRDGLMVIAKIKYLYGSGLDAEEVESVLSKEFPITIDDEQVVPYEMSMSVPFATRDDVVVIVGELKGEIERLREEVATSREYIDDRLEKRDQALMQTMKMMLERAQDHVKAQNKRRWWPFG